MAQMIRMLPYLIALGPLYEVISWWGWKYHIKPDEKEIKINARFQDFIQSQQIRKDVRFLTRGTLLCQTRGSHFYLKRGAYCFYNPNFYNVDEHAFSFYVKRELLCIKGNDIEIFMVAIIVAGVAAAYLFSGHVSILTTCILAKAARSIVGFSYGRYSIFVRDKTMLYLATNEDLKGRIRLLRAIIQGNRVLRESSLLSSFTFLPSGEPLVQSLFYSLAGCIKETERILEEERKDPFVDGPDNDVVQGKLVSHIINFNKASLKKQVPFYRQVLNFALF